MERRISQALTKGLVFIISHFLFREFLQTKYFWSFFIVSVFDWNGICLNLSSSLPFTFFYLFFFSLKLIPLPSDQKSPMLTWYIWLHHVPSHTQFQTKPITPRGVMVKVMDCGIVVGEFELQSRYYVHFRTNILGKGINSLSSSYGWNSSDAILLECWLWH